MSRRYVRDNGWLWRRLRADETSIKYVLFAGGLASWLLTTGGMRSTPAALGHVANGGIVVLILWLVARTVRRLRPARDAPPRGGFDDA